MWIHFAGAIYSATTIFVFPLLVLAAIAGAEILLDRTLLLVSVHAAKIKTSQLRQFGPATCSS